jgi:DNA-binding transcriptional LysR family regulator
MNLTSLDMNLLKVLNVLIEERSVTRASERLGRSQPAISNALSRLRQLFGDELLVRSPGGLTLTPRAQDVRKPLRDMMRLAETCLTDASGFDASSVSGLLRFGAPNRLSLPILPPLVALLRKRAPGLSLHLVTVERERALEAMDQDEIDFALGWFDHLPSHFSRSYIFEENFVCLCRPGHPILNPSVPFDIERLLSFPHLLVSATGQHKGIFDEFLARMGRERNILASVPNFSTAPNLLKNSDMIGVFTNRISIALQANVGLKMLEIPIKLDSFDVNLVWHARNDQDLKHVWMRQAVQSVCCEL